jgi:hypothetical protein
VSKVGDYLKNFTFLIVITSLLEVSILPVSAQEAALFKSAIKMFDLWLPRIGGVAGVVSIVCSFNECKKEKIPPKQVEPPQKNFLHPFAPYNFSTSSLLNLSH